MHISQIAKLLDAKLIATNDPWIEKLAPLDKAVEGDISFFAKIEYENQLKNTQASAIILAEPRADCNKAQLIHPHPYQAYVKLANYMYSEQHPYQGISDRACIAVSAKIAEGVSIAPGVCIADDVVIEKGCVIYPGVIIAKSVHIGENCILFPHVVIYHDCKIGKHCRIHAGAVIGSDGFGYVQTPEETIKIPQIGFVKVGNYVEIGANTTIDRAAMGATTIADHTKLDSQVHIAHNCEIGERCMFSAFSGVAGSSKVKDRVTIGGHSGINGHINIASDIRIGALSGVVSSLSEPGDYIGFPAVEAKLWRKQAIYLKRIEAMDKRIKELEAKMTTLGC